MAPASGRSSPTRGTIAYSDEFRDAIYLVHPDGTGRRPLTRGFAGEGAPSPELSWSPDGKQIAFTRPPHLYGGDIENPGKPVMSVINTDGSGERRLGRAEWLVWSPDGARIAFTRGGIVHLINRDGSGERRLGRGGGTQIVVRRDFARPVLGEFGVVSRKSAIWMWNVDGSGGRQIWPREGVCNCVDPAWQPG